MARSRTRADIRAEIMARGDLRAMRHTATEVNTNINQSYAKLWRTLVKVNKDFFADYQDVTVASGNAAYSLDGDFYKVLGVEVQDDGKWYPLPRFNWSERNQYQDGGSEKRNAAYRVVGSQLRLRPTPLWSGTVRLHFIPAPPVLTGDSDTLDGVAGYEEIIILDCLIKAKVKDEDDWAELAALRKEMLDDIISDASERDDSEPDRWRDVQAEGRMSSVWEMDP